MHWFSDDSPQAQAYEQVSDPTQDPNHTSDIVAGAAAYEAVMVYYAHVAQNGDPDDSEKTKELLRGFVSAFVDREQEMKGLDIDVDATKQLGFKQVEEAYESSKE
ncbi:hypothetical protein ACJ41O_001053 [Fusarium nematophilum]